MFYNDEESRERRVARLAEMEMAALAEKDLAILNMKHVL